MTAPQDDEFGPWQLHDGKGCPCVGQMVHLIRANGEEEIAIAERRRFSTPVSTAYHAAEVDRGIETWWQWVFDEPMFAEVIRFRIRRPKGMAILNAILADLPAPVKTDGVIA